jgi:flagellar hook-length control protein FliK
MYKEMSAPENPTTVLLLSQIQTTVKLPVQENAEVTEKETTAQRTKDNTLDVQINKQFDEFLPKEMPTIVNGTKSTSNSNTEQPKQSTVLSEKIVKELNIESLNSETAQNSASGDLMQNQSPQEQTVKIMIQGEIKSDVNIQFAKTAEVKPVEITPSKIIEQISKQLEGMYNNSKLEMVLNPGTLGKLHLHLMNTKEGLVAQFTVTTQEARDLLMKGLNGLKDVLLAQGVSVDTVSVKLEESDNDTGFDWDDKEGSQGGNKQQGTRKQKEEKKPFEQMMFEIENDDNLV